MIPALFLIPLVALFRIFVAWQPVNSGFQTWSWMIGFTPLAAVALCSGAFLAKRLALVLPLGILLASDAIVDAHYGVHFFSWFTLVNYALLAIVVLGGMTLRTAGRLPGFGRILGGTFVAALFFYVASNAIVWIGSPDYPRSLAGLWQALTLGLPGYPPSYVFFRNELVSDGLYSMVFLACVRLTLPRGERIRSSQPAALGTGASLADAPHPG